IVAACGFLTSIFALIISFFPPSQLVGKSIHEYLTILSVSFVITVLIPFVIYSITCKKNR
ncbi:amino acid transporter, partial [Parabacteroides merdae]|nr:amino acid transporter [Parabacteroides merdae]